jgi:hypothetical protein
MLLSIYSVCMLVYESSTLRDILYSRMKGFTHVWFFNILSDTLLTIDTVGQKETSERVAFWLKAKPTSSETVFEFEFDKVWRQHCLV